MFRRQLSIHTQVLKTHFEKSAYPSPRVQKTNKAKEGPLPAFVHGAQYVELVCLKVRAIGLPTCICSRKDQAFVAEE